MPRYPSLLEVNTRVLLTRLSAALAGPAGLDDIPDALLDEWQATGHDWIWMLSVWATGPKGQALSRSRAEWLEEYQEALPDLQDADIGGSGFAIAGYRVDASIGGKDALARLRERLHQRGMKLMLDFVPNHVGPDHRWVEDHPEYFVEGTEDELAAWPARYFRATTRHGEKILAYGRDPYFDGWPDTVQLDYSNPLTPTIMTGELLRIAAQCDGVRCDMAMLVQPDIFERTWGRRGLPFWPDAIRTVREKFPGFTLMAEVYWDLEWSLQQQGFDYTYDKRLYDRLREGVARPVREHFYAGLDFQDRLARFLENHDEPRAAAVFPIDRYAAALALTYLVPGLRFFHEGQASGWRKHISPHLIRGPLETEDPIIRDLYDKLFELLRQPILRDGQWRLLSCLPSWPGNDTWDNFIAFDWRDGSDERLLVAINLADHQGQCYVHFPDRDMADRQWTLSDYFSDAVYTRDGTQLGERGLYLDVPAWKAHVFKMNKEH